MSRRDHKSGEGLEFWRFLRLFKKDLKESPDAYVRCADRYLLTREDPDYYGHLRVNRFLEEVAKARVDLTKVNDADFASKLKTVSELVSLEAAELSEFATAVVVRWLWQNENASLGAPPSLIGLRPEVKRFLLAHRRLAVAVLQRDAELKEEQLMRIVQTYLRVRDAKLYWDIPAVPFITQLEFVATRHGIAAEMRSALNEVGKRLVESLDYYEEGEREVLDGTRLGDALVRLERVIGESLPRPERKVLSKEERDRVFKEITDGMKLANGNPVPDASPETLKQFERGRKQFNTALMREGVPADSVLLIGPAPGATGLTTKRGRSPPRSAGRTSGKSNKVTGARTETAAPTTKAVKKTKATASKSARPKPKRNPTKRA